MAQEVESKAFAKMKGRESAYQKVEVKDCPFCGCSDMWLMKEVGGCYDSLWFVKCSGCNARSCYADTNEGAKESWNQRPEQTPAEPDDHDFSREKDSLVQILNQARCLEKRVIGNRELSERILSALNGDTYESAGYQYCFKDPLGTHEIWRSSMGPFNGQGPIAAREIFVKKISGQG